MLHAARVYLYISLHAGTPHEFIDLRVAVSGPPLRTTAVMKHVPFSRRDKHVLPFSRPPQPHFAYQKRQQRYSFDRIEGLRMVSMRSSRGEE